jgi:hypothetical protein
MLKLLYKPLGVVIGVAGGLAACPNLRPRLDAGHWSGRRAGGHRRRCLLELRVVSMIMWLAVSSLSRNVLARVCRFAPDRAS